jgi:hypothetical protein
MVWIESSVRRSVRSGTDARNEVRVAPRGFEAEVDEIDGVYLPQPSRERIRKP